MQSIILKKVSKLLLGISLILAVFFLLRGHHKPGGGFIGGILASAGFIFYAMIHGTKAVEKLIRVNTRFVMALGLTLAVTAFFIPVLLGQAPMTGIWVTLSPFPGMEAHLGTPLLFDLGVFFVVLGVILSIIFSIMEVLEWNL